MGNPVPDSPHSGIESVLKEDRFFSPSIEFSAQAHIGSKEVYDQLVAEGERDPEGFWARAAKELHWFRTWDQVLKWEYPHAEWFVGGTLNVAYNCLDRHLSGPRRNKAAIIWEGEPGEIRTLTYQQLYTEVCRFANVLKRLGVKKGDRVAIYMPMMPEAAVAMLACARIGAPHTVVFAGFSADALRDRITNCGCVAVITADGAFRRGNEVALKPAVDRAIDECPSVQNVVVLKRTGTKIHMEPGRDHWWHELTPTVSNTCPAEELDSEHPLYILYTSGTTGKPKGILHTTGGYLTQVALTSKIVFDLKETDTYWCSADIGWVTGHSYVVYGPLANGATVFMYEGAPNFPQPDRFWEIIDRHQITIFYTAPTAIRAFIKWGEQWTFKHDLNSLRLLGTVGEPINPEAWMWYSKVIGKGRCPIVDTWWQTETGAILITPIPGVTATMPGTATRPFPGLSIEIRTKENKPVGPNEGGYLVITKPWPSMLRTLWGDDERYVASYWSEIPGVYFAGDGARRDSHGNFWIMGRVDDVVNVSGHRLGTAEVESALVSHPAVAEAAVVGRPDELKGQAIAAFVTLEGTFSASEELKKELREHVTKEIGALARPDDIRFTDSLPKTRSGKIMRRLLREIASGSTTVGDTTTLEDMSVLERLREDEE
ncbi:MAG: acetate--CoA ligase [Acidobacteria bacterium]|nr:acetate--CoA ligase [Acidobacteriota bacterium]